MPIDERKQYLNAYSRFIWQEWDEFYDFLLENDNLMICESCSWSGYYDTDWNPLCESCDWNWYVEEIW